MALVLEQYHPMLGARLSTHDVMLMMEMIVLRHQVILLSGMRMQQLGLIRLDRSIWRG
jgi:hypothetical protein